MKNNTEEKSNIPYTPWHPTFQYVLQVLLPNDIFDIEAENEIGKLPLKIDFIVIKKLKDVKAKLPLFFDFLNDYKYAILEYKSPKDYFTFFDYIKLEGYSKLYCIKEQINNLSKVFLVGIFSRITEKTFKELKINCL